MSTLPRRRVPARLRAGLIGCAALLVPLALTLHGCGKNSPTTVLVPTGIRPSPEFPIGVLTGRVLFDSGTYPGLDQAPFPPATVQLFRGPTLAGATLFRTQVTPPGDPTFLFTNLPPGDYRVTVRSHAFSPRTSPAFRVVDRTRDAGDLRLSANTRDSLASLTFVVGTMPGYGPEEIGAFTNYCDATVAGRWTFPNVLFTPGTIPAGTYRLKFVTDASSSAGNLIGWGGDGVTVLTAPVVAATARFGTGAASDLVVNFPVSGVYEFIFDERRLTIDIRLVPPGTARPTAPSAAPITRRFR